MKRSFLIIMDGWGIGPKASSDAILQANTPYVDQLLQQYPHSTLVTYGEEVGLPEGQMGNSEVGHLNIGAGRVVWQELARINKAIRERELDQNKVLLKAIKYAKDKGKTIHLLGLVSDGGVHSHIEHLKALVRIIETEGGSDCAIHAFTDGRDCDPKSGKGFIEDLETFLEGRTTRIASVTGRYYAMDRDKRWERVREAYDVLVNGISHENRHFSKASEGIAAAYAAGITDEFVRAYTVGASPTTIQSGDVVLCFNFRTDRLRELSAVLSQQDMPEFDMQKLALHFVTLVRYDESFQGVEVMFEKDDVSKTLGEIVSEAGLTQTRIAETEKYPHVTFFFSGGREAPFVGEERLMVPSPKVPTYDLQPEMSAHGITESIMKDIRERHPDFICLNFANADMVGHTGVFSAAIKAAETVDECLSKIVPLALEEGYACLLIADHGNSDYMINEDGSPNTAHTKNPVPCILVQNGLPATTRLRDGRLADVAPTLLHLMGVAQPTEMTGKTLIETVK